MPLRGGTFRGMPSWLERWIEQERNRREARRFTALGMLRRAEANLAPGVLTVEGFLGRDQRSLLRLLREDERAFQDLGLDWNEVAARLEHLLHRGAEGLGEPITVDGTHLVRVAETRGMFACPWEDGLFRKRSATVRRLGSDGQPQGAELLFSDLSLHLLKEHHFLQGLGSPFRLEPSRLQEVLG